MKILFELLLWQENVFLSSYKSIIYKSIKVDFKNDSSGSNGKSANAKICL